MAQEPSWEPVVKMVDILKITCTYRARFRVLVSGGVMNLACFTLLWFRLLPNHSLQSIDLVLAAMKTGWSIILASNIVSNAPSLEVHFLPT